MAKQRAVSRWINTNRPLIGGLLETRVKHMFITDTIGRLLPGWRFETNHSIEAENGRVVVVLNPLLSVVIYAKMDQLILCGVFNPATQQSVTVAFIYARNCIVQRRRLWCALRTFAESSPLNQSPWIVMGDFNQVLNIEEAYSYVPAPISLRGISNFSDCLSAAGLFDLASRGCQFTWSNKSPSSPKARKLDRALVNEVWRQNFHESNAFFDVPGCSDHPPCLVTISTSEDRRHSRFIFFNFFSTHPKYSQRLREAWSSVWFSPDPMVSLSQKLQAAKTCCKSINHGFFSNIEKRVKEAFEELEFLQRQMMNSPSQDTLKERELLEICGQC